MSSSLSREQVYLWGNTVALCDTQTDGGGWIVIQRRTKGDVDFYRDWNDYKNGFGTPYTDYWIGNDVIHNLTSQGYTELRVDLGAQSFAHYTHFVLGDEISNYQLTVEGYNGTAWDGLISYHNGMPFSTYDRDNDHDYRNCAETFHGAWWYVDCFSSNLNGMWGAHNISGVLWVFSAGYSLSFTEMKVRHV